MFVRFVNLVVLSKIKNLQDAVNRILVIDGTDITLINVFGIPLLLGGFVIKFPVVKRSVYLGHLKTESLKLFSISSTDSFLAFLFPLQADPLILLMSGFLTPSIDVKVEIIDQFECGLLCIQVKHLLNKVDNVPVGSAPKTVKPLIDLHAGMFVIMKRAACHAAPSYR